MCYRSHKCVTSYEQTCKTVLRQEEKGTKDVAGAVEIVICLQRERTYIYSGIRVFKDQRKDGAIVKHPRAVPLNEDLQSQIEKYEKIRNHPIFAVF